MRFPLRRAADACATGLSRPRPARWQAERLDAERRQARRLRELDAAIAAGDTTYHRLSDRLEDFGARLAGVRVALSAAPGHS